MRDDSLEVVGPCVGQQGHNAILGGALARLLPLLSARTGQLWPAHHSVGGREQRSGDTEARDKLAAQPLPRVLERAVSKGADPLAFACIQVDDLLPALSDPLLPP